MAMRRLMTADELLRKQPPDKSTELVQGRMTVREPPSGRHGIQAARLLVRVAQYVAAHQPGEVFAQDTGFQIASDPDTVLAPDVAFVRAARASLIPAYGYPRMAPDLVAEIVSPGDRLRAVSSKAAQWLEAGVELVWVLDPIRMRGQVLWRDGHVEEVPADGDITGGDVLPGFRCALAEVFR